METLASGNSAPAIADNTAPVTSGEADAKPAETTSDGSAPSLPEAQTPAPKDKLQERIDKLTRDKYDALREADLARYQAEQFKAQLAEMDRKESENEQVTPANQFPTLEQYGYDEAKFVAAVVAYNKANTEVTKATAREEAQAIIKAEREAAQQAEAEKNWATKEAEFIKLKPDYAEKVIEGGRRREWLCAPESAQLIKQSAVGPQIAYYLAENTEQAAAIARLSPMLQAREIGRIEAKIELTKLNPKPAVSQAPPPVSKVETAESAADKAPEDMVGATPAQFDKWRRKYSRKR